MFRLLKKILSMFKPQPKIVKVKIKKGKSKKKSYYQQIKENNPEKYEAFKKYQRERQRKIRIEAKEQKQANTEFEKGTFTDTQKQDEKKEIWNTRLCNSKTKRI